MVGSLERKERMVKSFQRKIWYDRQTEMDGRIVGKKGKNGRIVGKIGKHLGSLEKKDR